MIAEATLYLPILAILWLVFAWMWQKVGYKSKKGAMYLTVGAVWLMFWHAFSVLATILVDIPQLSMIGTHIGGGLAFIFGLIAVITLTMEALK